MEARFRLWWQYIRQRRLLTIGFIVALIVFILAVWWFGWDWTGFNGGYSQITTTNTSHGTTTAIVKPPGKNLWDLLQLLGVLAIPVVVGFGAVRYTRIQQLRDQEHEELQHKRDQEAAKIQHDHDQQLADQRAESERKDAEERARLEHEIALDNQREAALQAYIDKMSELLLHEKIREPVFENALGAQNEAQHIARARTLTVLSRLDASRKRSVIQFLHESNLITKNECIVHLNATDPDGLNGADLSGADLSGAFLGYSDLSKINLSKANLSKATLAETDLSEANLSGTDLHEARLSWGKWVIDTTGANLSGADLGRADLSRAIMNDVILVNADLSRANLSDADLSGANLTNAKVTSEQLNQAKSLKGATMPDGSPHS